MSTSPTTKMLANGDYFSPHSPSHSYSNGSTTPHTHAHGGSLHPQSYSSTPFLSPSLRASQSLPQVSDQGQQPLFPRRASKWARGKGMTFEEVQAGNIISEEDRSLDFEEIPISEEAIKGLPKKLRPYYTYLSLLASHYEEVDSLLSGSLPQDIALSFSPQRTYLQRLGDLEEDVASPGGHKHRRASAWKVKRSRTTDQYGCNGGNHDDEVQRGDGDREEAGERTGLLSGLTAAGEGEGSTKEERRERLAKFALNVNTVVNVLLVVAKVIAVLYSSSISLTASLVDSALDLLSTLIILATSWAIGIKTDRHKYPAGKRRFEPLGVLIFSVAMIASFVQVFIESFQRATGPAEKAPVVLSWLGVGVMLATIGIKSVLWVWCSRIPSSGVQALAQDAENDVFFNIMSLAFPWIGSFLHWRLLDPIGGMVLSTYIIVEWVKTLLQNFANLSGRSASRDQITRVLYLVTRFNPVLEIADVECYHIGDDLIVEIDVILPRSSSLHFAHDVGETIQCVLESLDGVIRAYVHCDYSSQNPLQHTARQPYALQGATPPSAAAVTSNLRQESGSSSGSETPRPISTLRSDSHFSAGQAANGIGSVPVESPQQI
ncbi:hypothetical protein I316_00907 [Kwoniella heveanensis BCC8398]|uniref:Cation efflux protein transmembrane domain-containing protein n=1 Tax=Kwoniella heveanensis BCC8398 TaxID=1296120 RepID=A0A1B9H145_9TREE|nr:hypothetical protein I316_00907 [Kwoniella heveanensis BCC8398]